MFLDVACGEDAPGMGTSDFHVLPRWEKELKGIFLHHPPRRGNCWPLLETGDLADLQVTMRGVAAGGPGDTDPCLYDEGAGGVCELMAPFSPLN